MIRFGILLFAVYKILTSDKWRGTYNLECEQMHCQAGMGHRHYILQSSVVSVFLKWYIFETHVESIFEIVNVTDVTLVIVLEIGNHSLVIPRSKPCLESRH